MDKTPENEDPTPADAESGAPAPQPDAPFAGGVPAVPPAPGGADAGTVPPVPPAQGPDAGAIPPIPPAQGPDVGAIRAVPPPQGVAGAGAVPPSPGAPGAPPARRPSVGAGVGTGFGLQFLGVILFLATIFVIPYPALMLWPFILITVFAALLLLSKKWRRFATGMLIVAAGMWIVVIGPCYGMLVLPNLGA